MTPEIAYKAAFGVAFLGVIAAALRAAFLMRRAGRKRQGGGAHEIAALRVLRPLLGIVFYATLIAWFVTTPPAPFQIALPSAVRWAGFAAVLAGALIVWMSIGALGRCYAAGVVLYEDHRLVTSGPYAFLRHPIYAAFVLMTLGGGVLAANWLLALSGVTLTMLFGLMRIGPEDALLEGRFGEAWRRYAEATGAVFPGIGRRRGS